MGGRQAEAPGQQPCWNKTMDASLKKLLAPSKFIEKLIRDDLTVRHEPACTAIADTTLAAVLIRAREPL